MSRQQIREALRHAAEEETATGRKTAASVVALKILRGDFDKTSSCTTCGQSFAEGTTICLKCSGIVVEQPTKIGETPVSVAKPIVRIPNDETNRPDVLADAR